MDKGKGWREATQGEKIAYFELLMWIANADGKFPLEQRELVVEILRRLELPIEEEQRILKKFFQKPDPDEVKQAVAKFRNNPLRFSLIGDVITLALSDDVIQESERGVIDSLARELNITKEQLQSIYLTILEARRIMKENMEREKKEKMLAKLNNPLLGLGLPFLLSAAFGWNVGGIAFVAWMGLGTISFLKKLFR